MKSIQYLLIPKMNKKNAKNKKTSDSYRLVLNLKNMNKDKNWWKCISFKFYFIESSISSI